MSTAKQPGFRWRWIAGFLGVLLAVIVITQGADRTAADPSAPISFRGPTIPIPAEQSTLRIVSFNIHSGKGGDNRLDLQRTASALNEPFDLAGLYEVRATPFSKYENQAADLADRLHTASAFAPSERQWWRDHFGNAILSRRPVSNLVRIPLPNTRGKAYRNTVLVRVPVSGTSSSRTLSHATGKSDRDEDVPDAVTILLTHIDRAEDRKQQLAIVIHLFLALEPPAILMGDLNTTAADPQLLALRNHPGVHSALHDALPDGPPVDTIDWLFHRGLKTVSAQLVDTSASDHPVLVVEVSREDHASN